MELYEIAAEVYKQEKKTKKKIGSSKISKKYGISIYYAKLVRSIADLYHFYDGTIDDIYSKYKSYESKYKSLLRRYNQLTKNNHDNHSILSEIEDKLSDYVKQISKFNLTSSNNISINDDKIGIAKTNNKTNKSEEDLVILLSDWHIGETVEPEAVGYLNEYNEEIARRRLETLADKVITLYQLHKNISNINRLHIACLGDMVSGHNLHEELDKTNNLNIAEQVLYTSTLLTSFILTLSDYFDEIIVYGVPGNHGRTTKKKEYKDPTSSYDYLAYKITEREILLLKENNKINSNIKFFIPKSHFVFTIIQNHNILFTHGDNIKSWSSIPYYGMLRDYNNKQELMLSAYNMPVHYLCIGHFHQPITINRPLGGIIVNGSLKGIDEFSINKNLISKPSQTLFGVNEKYGRTFLYELYVE